jgi:hypothetical protein
MRTRPRTMPLDTAHRPSRSRGSQSPFVELGLANKQGELPRATFKGLPRGVGSLGWSPDAPNPAPSFSSSWASLRCRRGAGRQSPNASYGASGEPHNHRRRRASITISVGTQHGLSRSARPARTAHRLGKTGVNGWAGLFLDLVERGMAAPAAEAHPIAGGRAGSEHARTAGDRGVRRRLSGGPGPAGHLRRGRLADLPASRSA